MRNSTWNLRKVYWKFQEEGVFLGWTLKHKNFDGEKTVGKEHALQTESKYALS